MPAAAAVSGANSAAGEKLKCADMPASLCCSRENSAVVVLASAASVSLAARQSQAVRNTWSAVDKSENVNIA